MKKLILVLLLFMPIVIFAKCDNDAFKKNIETASSITYDLDYNKGRKLYTVKIYGISKKFYIEYDKKTYKPTNNSITLSNIKEGTSLSIAVYGNDDCGVSKYLYIKAKYFNDFYGSEKCYGYEDKLTICNSEFTDIKITEDYLEKAKYHIDNPIITEREKVTVAVPEPENNIFEDVKDFVLNWGVKIGLLALTTALSVTFYNNRFKKIKHKI